MGSALSKMAGLLSDTQPPKKSLLGLLGEAQGPYGPMGSGTSVLGLLGSQYPGIGGSYSAVRSPDDGSGRVLEFWPPDEPGDQSYPRPKGIPLNRAGVELFGDKAKPSDIAADIVSHSMVNTDPTVSSLYNQFTSSFTPQQDAILQDQYAYAIQNEGERRPFEQWKQIVGLPAYMRGYAFQQWPATAYDKMYTPQQRQMLDQLVQYLKTPRKP